MDTITTPFNNAAAALHNKIREFIHDILKCIADRISSILDRSRSDSSRSPVVSPAAKAHIVSAMSEIATAKAFDIAGFLCLHPAAYRLCRLMFCAGAAYRIGLNLSSGKQNVDMNVLQCVLAGGEALMIVVSAIMRSFNSTPLAHNLKSHDLFDVAARTAGPLIASTGKSIWNAVNQVAYAAAPYFAAVVTSLRVAAIPYIRNKTSAS